MGLIILGVEDKLRCPVARHLLEGVNIRVEELVVYGLRAKNCNKCQGYDKRCEIYEDYLRKQKLKEIKNG